MPRITKRVIGDHLALTIHLSVLLVLTTAKVHADVVFESGTLGPTGISWQEALDGLVPGSSVDANVFSGVRFELTQPVVTSAVGGHFFSPAGGDFFGAIVALDGPADFPDSAAFSTPDVLGTIVLTFPVASAEVFGDLALSLDTGWYALVFGSGQFDVSGVGGMVLNNPDIGDPSYIAWQEGDGWLNITEISNNFVDYRFVVRGIVIPEPATIVLLFLATLIAMLKRKPQR
jgi:hypothetical protein